MILQIIDGGNINVPPHLIQERSFSYFQSCKLQIHKELNVVKSLSHASSNLPNMSNISFMTTFPNKKNKNPANILIDPTSYRIIWIFMFCSQYYWYYKYMAVLNQ